MGEKLLPCPFCGQEGAETVPCLKGFVTVCCECTGDHSIELFGKTAVQSVRAWNTRATPQPMPPVDDWYDIVDTVWDHFFGPDGDTMNCSHGALEEIVRYMASQGFLAPPQPIDVHEIVKAGLNSPVFYDKNGEPYLEINLSLKNFNNIRDKAQMGMDVPQPIGAWLPIESAPCDGRNFLVTDGKTVDIARWSSFKKRVVKGSGYNYNSLDIFSCATHWMPLPKPPEDR